MTMLISKQVGVYLVEGEIVLDAQRSDEGVVVQPEAGEDVVDDLLLTKWLPDRSKRVRQGLHRSQLRTDLDDLCA
jgi:hypothetical protein